ncbi:hypothetical protein Hypma_010763 [Hypsizygus marmoreus]|uniref:Decapping nuclease n=1 Tax=Hypsizygus marmoreus TaxID=39966 RepID=A0A369JS91_HYPMA|nr:hypothetical protein Hypma_010763 [Hypsizygus marmoreus]
MQITAPGLDLNEFDLITDRKNLRALYNFVKSGKKQWGRHRIDAEIVNGTVLFYLGWSGSGYGYYQSYGMKFEKKFTTPLSKGTIQHCRVIEYGLGGLKMMVKYQVDACLNDGRNLSMITSQAESSTGMTSTGFRITHSGTIVAPHNIVEIKTISTGYRPDHPRTLTQLWFSRTPILMAGYHDRNGRFSSVEKIDVEATGALDQWEEQNTETLQKIIRLLEMVKTQLLSSPIKRQAIVLTNLRSYDCVEFYSLSDDYEMGLPDDLRRKWA